MDGQMFDLNGHLQRLLGELRTLDDSPIGAAIGMVALIVIFLTGFWVGGAL